MANTSNSGSNNGVVTIVAVAVISVLVLGAVYLMQDRRTTSERLGDAVSTVPQGLDKAVDKLGDQSPADNVERNVDDAAKKVDEAVE